MKKVLWGHREGSIWLEFQGIILESKGSVRYVETIL